MLYVTFTAEHSCENKSHSSKREIECFPSKIILAHVEALMKHSSAKVSHLLEALIQLNASTCRMANYQ